MKEQQSHMLHWPSLETGLRQKYLPLNFHLINWGFWSQIAHIIISDKKEDGNHSVHKFISAHIYVAQNTVRENHPDLASLFIPPKNIEGYCYPEKRGHLSIILTGSGLIPNWKRFTCGERDLGPFLIFHEHYSMSTKYSVWELVNVNVTNLENVNGSGPTVRLRVRKYDNEEVAFGPFALVSSCKEETI
ncbi:hypothetical protein BC937DRAFT_88812 [Endogone sp. FLAS-F59071]|nr:hypothetical protein BC937DRAFT_88812 [Endogone sp. FLAS-F59071]|eukprot:RUS22484.1 hypothetical protein BC937DRAFT_88812 [Endogone sp. FLAS-F59071]